MADDVQSMQELIAQLRAENEQLRQLQSSLPGTSDTTVSGAPSTAPSVPVSPVMDRLVFVPRDRKCPMFRGRSGVGLNEWLEEANACMRSRHLSEADKAFFLYDHLEGEAKEELRYRTTVERSNPDNIVSILRELYGCTDSYVSLQEAFFSRKQQEGETLQEFSLALMGLMEKVRTCAPTNVLNSDVLLRDQFVEHVLDGSLRRELKQFVRLRPTSTLLEVRAEAMRWEREGLPGSARGRSHSVPSLSFQYAVQGGPQASTLGSGAELLEMRQLLMRQQEQLDQLTRNIASLRNPRPYSHNPRNGPLVCRRCQQPGHFARECDGVRVPPRSQSHGPHQASAHAHPPAVSEN